MNAEVRNPFATRCVKPGAIGFEFPAGESTDTLIQRLKENNWRGEIVGPHGGGKSTLLAELLPCLRQQFPLLWFGKIAGGQRSLHHNGEAPDWASAGLVVIDGYEQLSWWSRWFAVAAANRHSCGMLVTCHESVGFPEIFRTKPTLALVQKLAQKLQRGGSIQITPAEVAACFEQHECNVRETWFALYDLFEHKRRLHRSG